MVKVKIFENVGARGAKKEKRKFAGIFSAMARNVGFVGSGKGRKSLGDFPFLREQVLGARVILLVDLDYFFAQCEERRNPSLKDKPVVVCVYSGRSEDSGAVSTANYLARKYGVKSGIPIFLAKKRLKKQDAVFLPVDHEFYDEVSAGIMSILRHYANSFEQVGIDEAYLDVTQRVGGDFKEAGELAQEIKEQVRAQQRLTCSIGVGPNKLVAKVAADIQKPDGLTVVEPEQVEGFLAPLPVDSLVGVGRKTAKKLQSLGIGTIGDLAKQNLQVLVEVFGKRFGTFLHNASIGMDDTPVRERGEAESVSRISTLKEDTRDMEVILEKADRLCDEVHARLVQRGVRFRSVGIVAAMADLSVRSRSKSLEAATNELEVFRDAVRELFEKFLGESGVKVRRVGVKVSNFVKEEETQREITDFVGLTKK